MDGEALRLFIATSLGIGGTLGGVFLSQTMLSERENKKLYIEKLEILLEYIEQASTFVTNETNRLIEYVVLDKDWSSEEARIFDKVGSYTQFYLPEAKEVYINLHANELLNWMKEKRDLIALKHNNKNKMTSDDCEKLRDSSVKLDTALRKLRHILIDGFHKRKLISITLKDK